MVVTVVVSAAGAPQLAAWVFLLVGLTGIVLEHAHARRKNEADTSLLMRFLGPRTYRGPRRLVLLTIASTVPSSLFFRSYPEIETVALVVMMIYALDRFLPVVERPDMQAAPGGGRSPWLWRVGVLGLAGLAALGFLQALPSIIGASDLDGKIADVRAGDRLTYGLLNPLALAEPRADPVDVRWVGANPPNPFEGQHLLRLTYFGQNAGTSIFLDTTARRTTVYRLPTAAIALEASAQSSLSADRELLPSRETAP